MSGKRKSFPLSLPQGAKLHMNKPKFSSKCGLGELKFLEGVKSEEIEILAKVNCTFKVLNLPLEVFT